MSTSYHPQSDGQTERVNQCLEGYLRCFVHSCPSHWKSWLSLAECWYNTSYHSSLNKTPFEVLYGQPPKYFGLDVGACAVPDLQTWLHERKLMTELLQQHLLRAQQRQKHQADKNRTEWQFQVGDSVYLKLQPYVQNRIATRAHHKLSFRCFGPYQVLARIGSVDYRLALPASSIVHPVFHVSQLKKAIQPNTPVSTDLPDSSIGSLRIPVQILDRRLKNHNNRLVSGILVKWSSWPVSMATWELKDELKHQFPAAPTWGQAGFKERGIVISNGQPNEEAQLPGPRPKRLRKPNTRITGLEWVMGDGSLSLAWR
ncbi:hypothetical protein BS78_09G208500 [Paspalum vaginatum]|nr:hypothetical protein BS78_09G208500 [Paspalum vaginatum]